PSAKEVRAGRRPAVRVNGDTGSELRVAVMEEDAACIVQTHNAADVFHFEGMRQPRVAHVFPGGVGEFALLEMKSRAGKAVEISDVVVMEMREDHIFYRVRIDVEQGQRLYRAAQERSLS